VRGPAGILVDVRFGAVLFVIATVMLLSAPAGAQDEHDEQDTPTVTLFDHPDKAPFYLGGQLNFIFQAHGDFHSPYSGPNSLKASAEDALSRVLTLYTGVRIARRWDVLFDVESAGGRGLSDALGLAGFTNLDVVRNPSLGSSPYIARVMVHGVIPLSDGETSVPVSPLSVVTHVPERRIEIRAGKISLVDFFDNNAVASDSHLQFTNWTVDNNGAFDYAADTRGYTFGVVAELDTPRWSVRWAEALMPTVANGIDLDWDIARARADNLEIELRPAAGTIVRLLGYANHANMGSYGEAIEAFEAGKDPKPDIVAHREQGRVKYGTGVNLQQDVTHGVRGFVRAGWNEGDNESFAYTEVNNTVSLGFDVRGDRWQRAGDRVGVAFVSNGLSELHREYLKLGGLGFLLGDGTLTYGRETIVETYYTARVWRGIAASAGLQYLLHPGYNRDRGPVWVPAARLHLDL
jgi:hypothetical protein